MAEIPEELSENLYPGETVLYSVKPKFLIVTDRRVIYLDQKILGRYNLVDIPYEKLEFVHFNFLLLLSPLPKGRGYSRRGDRGASSLREAGSPLRKRGVVHDDML